MPFSITFLQGSLWGGMRWWFLINQVVVAAQKINHNYFIVNYFNHDLKKYFSAKKFHASILKVIPGSYQRNVGVDNSFPWVDVKI